MRIGGSLVPGFSVEAGGRFELASATLVGSTGFSVGTGLEGFTVSAGCGVGVGGIAGLGCTLAVSFGVVARLIGTPPMDSPLGWPKASAGIVTIVSGGVVGAVGVVLPTVGGETDVAGPMGLEGGFTGSGVEGTSTTPSKGISITPSLTSLRKTNWAAT